jgi:hypothetical protein
MAELDPNLEPTHKQNLEPKDKEILDPTLPSFISVGTPWTEVAYISFLGF